MAVSRNSHDLRAAAESVAVVPFIFLFGIFWPLIFGYTPSELVSLDGVPRILQGETDWGQANVFATYVAGHFVFGTVGCILYVYVRGKTERSQSPERVLAGFVVTWGVLNAINLGGFVNSINLEDVSGDPAFERYYVCDYLQVLFLFIVTYLASVLWIRFWAWRQISLPIQLRISPAMILVLGVVGADGITPKAGRVVAGDRIIPYHANGKRHAALLTIHRFCTSCTGGDAAIPRRGEDLGATKY